MARVPFKVTPHFMCPVDPEGVYSTDPDVSFVVNPANEG